MKKTQKPLTPEVVEETTALTIQTKKCVPKAKGKTPGQRINYLHKLSIEAGKISIAAAITAGWELTKVKQSCPFGAWLTWLHENTELSPDTAQRYMGVYAATVGAARCAAEKPVGLEVAPTADELTAASSNVEAKSLTRLYSQLKLLKRNPDHGGTREGAGRKEKKEDIAAKLDAITQSEALNWARAKVALDELDKMELDEKFAILSDEHLAEAALVLNRVMNSIARVVAARAEGSAS